MNNKVVTKANDILGIKDLREERVYVEQWDMDVTVREFSGRELQSVLKLSSFSGGDTNEVLVTDIAKVCAIAIKDGDGNRIFTDEQVDELAEKNMKPLMVVFNAALRVSGMTADEQEKEKNG